MTTPIDRGPLANIDLVDLGSRSGMLWRSEEIVLVGLGDSQIREVEGASSSVGEMLAACSGEPTGVAGVGPVAFGVLPFDRGGRGTFVLPSVVIAQSAGQRWLTKPDGVSLGELDDLVGHLVAEPVDPMPSEIRLELERSANRWRDDVVGVARDRILESPIEKAVLARLLTLQANADFPIARIVRDLAGRFGTANLFCIDGFVGASPELLVSRSGRTVRAHPLAGTAARRAEPAADAAQVSALLSSTKDRTEHRITIDWLLEELLPFCSYVDAEPEPSIVTLSNVHHLGTLVEGVLSEPAAPVLDLVHAVHPTPAVGGKPQDAALELIRELEGFDRGRYAGPAGWIDAAGNGQFAVSVRTAQISGSTATIAAGVGVVAQSDPEAELIETQAKFRAMLGTFLGAPTQAAEAQLSRNPNWVDEMKVKATELARQASPAVLPASDDAQAAADGQDEVE